MNRLMQNKPKRKMAACPVCKRVNRVRVNGLMGFHRDPQGKICGGYHEQAPK